MKRLLAISLLLACNAIAALAQEPRLHAAGVVKLAEGSGFDNPIIGGGIGARLPLGSLFSLALDGEVLLARKHTAGGFNLNTTDYLRVGKSYFAQAGIRAFQQRTSSYTKASVMLAVGGGYNYHNKAIASASYLLPDHTSGNRERGVEIAGDFYLRPRNARRWGFYTRVAADFLRFRSFCPVCRELQSTSVAGYFGVYWK